MEKLIQTGLALLPFLIIIYFLLIKEKKAYHVMIGAYITTLISLIFFWNLDFASLFGASIKGILIAFEIFLIIFSILLIFNLLKEKGHMNNITIFFSKISTDKHFHIILIGWFLVCFFESIAGFGTPAAIAAPLLVSIGIRPLTAIIITLVADSAAVAFGAFGTPINFGIIETIPSLTSNQTQTIIEQTAIINGIISLFIPLLLLFLYQKLENKKESIKPYLSTAIIAGGSFGFAYIITAIFIGPELPSVIGAIFGFTITYLKIKNLDHKKNITTQKNKDLLIAISPYISLIILFIISRLNLLGFGDLLKMIGFTINFNENISYSFSFFTPGILILIIFVIFKFIFKTKKIKKNSIIQDSFNKSKPALFTLIFTLAFVQILLISKFNQANINGIPQTIALLFSSLGPTNILISPLLGAFGAFISGSATVSNLLFATIQLEIASLNGLSQTLLLALQTIGASAGNMIAIHNIVAVSALVGLYHKEGKIIKINSIIVLCYCILATIIGIIIY